MSRYVVAVKRGRRAAGVTITDVLQVPGVSLASGNAFRAIIEAPASAAAEIVRLFDHDVMIEPEILHHMS